MFNVLTIDKECKYFSIVELFKNMSFLISILHGVIVYIGLNVLSLPSIEEKLIFTGLIIVSATIGHIEGINS